MDRSIYVNNLDDKSYVQQSFDGIMDLIKNDKKVTKTSVSNGCVDYKGNIADKRTTGGWKASPFIIVNEVAERLAFFAVAVSMVQYLVFEMHQSLPDAAAHVNDWIGAAYVLTLLGAFWLMPILAGMILLTLSASIDSLRPPQCTKKPCIPSTNSQISFLYGALYLIALGTGGIKPCVSTFGADQFDESDKKESQKKYAFFNWFFFAINMGALLGITLMVYVQQEKGWTWGFAVPTIAMFASIFILIVGFSKYRFQKPMGSAFTRFVQVIVASIRNHFRGVVVGNEGELYEMKTKESDIFGARKLPHTKQYRFLDKAAVITDPEIITNNKWKLCTVTQVEEFKSFIRILPIWASTIALSISFAQLSTFFLTQANIMDRKLGPHFTIPAGSVPVFTALNGLLLVPIYEKFIVPYLRTKTGHQRGITSLQRIGVGLFVSIFALMSAALVERIRRSHSNPKELSIFWLFPQFFLVNWSFYDEATDGTRSISGALFLSEIGIGSWISSAIVKMVESATGGVAEGWITNDLNKSKLDYFYLILTGINGVNFLVYLIVAWRYKGRNYGRGTIRDESTFVELDDQPQKENYSMAS
ncbi:unnamed protein product [Withania somnifera]